MRNFNSSSGLLGCYKWAAALCVFFCTILSCCSDCAYAFKTMHPCSWNSLLLLLFSFLQQWDTSKRTNWTRIYQAIVIFWPDHWRKTSIQINPKKEHHLFWERSVQLSEATMCQSWCCTDILTYFLLCRRMFFFFWGNNTGHTTTSLACANSYNKLKIEVKWSNNLSCGCKTGTNQSSADMWQCNFC